MLIDPFPENNIFREFNVFEFGLLIHIKNLEDMSFCFAWSFESYDVIFDVHNGSINLVAWSFNKVHLVENFHNTKLWDVCLINISDANISLRFEMSDVELEELGINSQIGQLEDLT